ncbi:mediator of RNA polymerase II transcription subunit 19a isoform X2 [Sesamum indicum]|uniref:Mediator of RNA polymerase II transcription subunit 19a isoform X2 n=1 Tax=Sesamum indicum TaxID=4182 RepID=A0A6I9SJR6_SESIN|nr:mediator of RNA polymerase II transcription subunit 19a isoform X2 [Sesamum indicum]XP_020555140.1 mediator of RNA polymerase II transcription subunit 19a isoform X2 [Sesamum indicum]
MIFVRMRIWPRELTGGLDLISYYKLLPHHEFFCKKSGSVSLLDTHYLYDVVGDTDIRKGEGMQLDQLIQNTFPRNTNSCIEPFNLDVLGEAFHLQESASVDLPPSEKGIPTVAVKPKSEFTAKDKHKKHKDKDREKDKDFKKHKHRSKEEKEKKKDKNHQKRKRDADEDTNGSKKHRKSKDKSSKNEVGLKVSSMRSCE